MRTNSRMAENHCEPSAGDPSLTDEQLIIAGLKPIRAYVRPGEGKAAKRHKNRRDARRAELGIIQVNVEAPVQVKETIKQLAERTRSGEECYRVLASLARDLAPPHLLPPTKTKEAINRERWLMNLGQRINNLTGWRRKVVKIVLTMKSRS